MRGITTQQNEPILKRHHQLKLPARRYHDDVAPSPRDTVSENNFPTDQDDGGVATVGRGQELRRDFNQVSAIAFNVILQGAWEVVLVASTEGLVNGGVAGLLWSYVWTFAGMTLVTLSLAEMVSMVPGPGGPYHWVAKFAPPGCRNFLSYLTGWMSTMAWQAGAASGPFIVGTLLRSLIELNTGSYHRTGWQDTFFVWFVATVVHFSNCYGRTALPIIQKFMLILHIFGFLIVRICHLLTMRSHRSQLIDQHLTLCLCSSQPCPRRSYEIHEWWRLAVYGNISDGWAVECFVRLWQPGRHCILE
jgi:amino acid permease